jgi:hypothetical protein
LILRMPKRPKMPSLPSRLYDFCTVTFQSRLFPNFPKAILKLRSEALLEFTSILVQF